MLVVEILGGTRFSIKVSSRSIPDYRCETVNHGLSILSGSEANEDGDAPRVALLVESSRAYGRGLLHGIAEYVRLHGPWSIYLAERGLGDAPPGWLDGWNGDGVIARIENRGIARVVSAWRCPPWTCAGCSLISACR